MRPLAAVALLVVVAGTGACSGDGDGGRTEPLARAALVERGDERCRRADEERDGIEAPTGPEDAPEYFRARREVEVELTEDLRALTPEPADETEYGQLLDRRGDLVDLLDRAIAASERDDGFAELITLTNDVARVEPEVQADFDAFGFTVCGGEARRPTTTAG